MNLASRVAFVLLGGFFLGACASAPDAVVPKQVPKGLELPPDAKTYTLDARSVTVEVDVSAGAAHTLRFKRFKGKLVYAKSKPEALTLAIEIDVKSAEATLDIVADIAKSSDFLDAEVYPLAHFSSLSVRKRAANAEGADDDAPQFDLFGKLTLKNREKTLQVPAKIEVEGCSTTIGSEFAINRREFGIESNGSFDGIVSDNVSLRIVVHLGGC